MTRSRLRKAMDRRGVPGIVLQQAAENPPPLSHEGIKEHKVHNILQSLAWCSFASLRLGGALPFSAARQRLLGQP